MGAGFRTKDFRKFLGSDPDGIIAGAVFPPGKAIPVDGGYGITGRWPFGSGCQHASWLLETAIIHDDEKPRLEDGRPVQLLFVLPAAHALGNARAAIDALVELGGKKNASLCGVHSGRQTRGAKQLGEAGALLGAARAYIYESIEAAWQTVERGQFLSQPKKIAIQLATSHAVRTSAKVVELVHQAAGTSAIRREQPFERRFRDAHVITQHAFGSMNRFESVGKLLFGQETDWPFFTM